MAKALRRTDQVEQPGGQLEKPSKLLRGKELDKAVRKFTKLAEPSGSWYSIVIGGHKIAAKCNEFGDELRTFLGGPQKLVLPGIKQAT